MHSGCLSRGPHIAGPTAAPPSKLWGLFYQTRPPTAPAARLPPFESPDRGGAPAPAASSPPALTSSPAASLPSSSSPCPSPNEGPELLANLRVPAVLAAATLTAAAAAAAVLAPARPMPDPPQAPPPSVVPTSPVASGGDRAVSPAPTLVPDTSPAFQTRMMPPATSPAPACLPPPGPTAVGPLRFPLPPGALPATSATGPHGWRLPVPPGPYLPNLPLPHGYGMPQHVPPKPKPPILSSTLDPFPMMTSYNAGGFDLTPFPPLPAFPTAMPSFLLPPPAPEPPAPMMCSPYNPFDTTFSGAWASSPFIPFLLPPHLLHGQPTTTGAAPLLSTLQRANALKAAMAAVKPPMPTTPVAPKPATSPEPTQPAAVATPPVARRSPSAEAGQSASGADGAPASPLESLPGSPLEGGSRGGEPGTARKPSVAGAPRQPPPKLSKKRKAADSPHQPKVSQFFTLSRPTPPVTPKDEAEDASGSAESLAHPPSPPPLAPAAPTSTAPLARGLLPRTQPSRAAKSICKRLMYAAARDDLDGMRSRSGREPLLPQLRDDREWHATEAEGEAAAEDEDDDEDDAPRPPRPGPGPRPPGRPLGKRPLRASPLLAEAAALGPEASGARTFGRRRQPRAFGSDGTKGGAARQPPRRDTAIQYLVRWDKGRGVNPKASPEAVVLRPEDETKNPTVEDRWHRLYPPCLQAGTRVRLRQDGFEGVAEVLGLVGPPGALEYEVRWEGSHAVETVRLDADTEDAGDGDFSWQFVEKPPLRRRDRVAVLYDTEYYEGVIDAVVSPATEDDTRVWVVERVAPQRGEPGGQQYLLRWEGYQEAEALSEKKGSPGDAAAGVLGGSGAASEDAPEEKGDLFSAEKPKIRHKRVPGTFERSPMATPAGPPDPGRRREEARATAAMLRAMRLTARKRRPFSLVPLRARPLPPRPALSDASATAEGSSEAGRPRGLGARKQPIQLSRWQAQQRELRREQLRNKVRDAQCRQDRRAALRRSRQAAAPDPTATPALKRMRSQPPSLGVEPLCKRTRSQESDAAAEAWQPPQSAAPPDRLAEASRALRAMVIVAVRPEEYEAAQDILEREFDLLPRMISGIVRKGNFDTRTMVVIWQGEAVGVSTLKLHKLKAQAPPVMEIVLFAIRGTYHKQGFGTVLAAALYELARRIRCSRVVLRAAPNAHGFWQRVGYADFVPDDREREILLHNNVEFNRGCIFMQRLAQDDAPPGVPAVLRAHQKTVSLVVDSVTGVVWEPDPA